MNARSLAARVAALEAKVGPKTLEEQFREQGELIDRRFFEVNQRLSALGGDLAALRQELSIVREGVSIILKKLS